MDKTAIKNFAIEARRSLIAGIKLRAATYGITENKIDKRLPASTNEIEYYVDDRNPLIGSDIAKRQKLVDELNRREKDDDLKTAFNDLVEEVAYTWFNRLIAIRFMEVNDYLPSRTRVLSSSQGRRDPDIMQDPVSLEEWLGRFNDEERALIKKAHESESTGDMDTLYRMLFIKQANALNDNLPKLFEKTNDYAELLFTPNYHDGVIQHLITDIDEADFDVTKGGQVEIIGWLYQYYNTEPHNQVVNITGGPVSKNEIPAATQLFTTDWVVRYMVDNSLGNYWIERHPDTQLKSELKFRLPVDLKEIVSSQRIEDIHLIDNAMGSGHILVYAFDIFMKMYLEEGYSSREAAILIIKNNLYGLEIDTRAFQLAYFALMMKAREFNRKALRPNTITPNVFVFDETDAVNEDFLEMLDPSSKSDIEELIELFRNARELGSIIQIDKDYDYEELTKAVENVDVTGLDVFGIQDAKTTMLKVLRIATMMTRKYEVTVTNPPYLNKFDPTLKKYLRNHYQSYMGDLFSVFIYNNINLTKPGGYSAYMTPFVWMFIKTYEKLRSYIISEKSISSLIQMEYSAFEEATVPINTFVLKNEPNESDGVYIKLSDFKGGMEVQKEKVLDALDDPKSGYLYRTNQANFSKIPGSPIAYWISDTVFNLFRDSKKIKDVGFSKKGLDTGNNAKYYRYWFEVMHNSNKWVPLNKGGNYRKWYGNHTYVINWEDNGQLIKNNGRANIRNEKFYFMESISWTDLTSGPFSSRLTPQGFIFDASGPSYFGDNLIPMLAYMNSKVFNSIAQVTMSTMHYTNGQVAQMPYIENIDTSEITKIAENNVEISKREWNSFEISWEFLKHPLVIHIADDKRTEVAGKLENAFKIWQQESKDRFDQLRSNEEELNRIFINLYGLNDELTPEVADKDVSVSLANEVRDIKSFLSYFVGIVFGRYSLDKSGLVFAGGNWDPDQYQAFKPNRDNLLILNDEQYYNDDRDIINRLKEFLGVTFGVQNIATNLDYIASVIGKRGASSEEQIRKYFVEDFFKDHKKVYQKRPIYWEFNSGKKNGFKALMYLHRYDRDELAMIRSDYLHSLQGCYEKRVNQLEQELSVGIVPREKKNLDKKVKTISAQINEIKEYDSTIQHLANKKIELDLDDGVLVNYAKLQDGFNILSKL
ncbi:BREX-1 system adenine-specific DNA-methyltransferase PglX [Lactiplantibacillus paraxiangfangensis]|uniref:BREX-1 system adenine-specific DNA-methyltransferase PglX n=1 Tax=Lactiplantibacillus paraxiangfangensis TaxID=3076224 RepID=UPI0030C71271